MIRTETRKYHEIAWISWLLCAMIGGVQAAPIINSHSAPRQVVGPGHSLAVSVTASGNGALTYQWSRNGRPVAGATGSSLYLSSISYQDSGYYLVDVTDPGGTTQSAPIFVIVAPAATQVIGWGDTVNPRLVLPAGLNDVVALVTSGRHALALRSGGTVSDWDTLTGGQRNGPAGLADVVAVATGGHSLALKSDGTVVSWGQRDVALNVPGGLGRVVAIAAGDNHSLALQSDGSVFAWGSNLNGQLNVPAGLTDVVAIAASTDVSVALKNDGKVVVWGSNTYGQTSVPADLVNVAAISVDRTHVLALKNDGSVVGWGNNTYGQTSAPVGLANVAAIAAGGVHSLALEAGGTVVAWGGNGSGQSSVPARVSSVFAIAASDYHSLVLHDVANDTLPTISTHPGNQIGVEDTTVTFIVAAAGGTSFLSYQWRRDGTPIVGATSSTLRLTDVTPDSAGNYDVIVSTWLGSVTSNPATLTINPVPVVSSLSPTRQVLHPGQMLSANAVASGTGLLSYRWTHNGYPIAGATSSSLTIPSVTLRDAGYYVVHITDDHGTRRAPVFVGVAPTITQARAWGKNSEGQTTVPSGLIDAFTVSAGHDHSLAVRVNGTVVAWGNYDPFFGVLDVPEDLVDVVAIDAGDFYSLALKSDGTVVAWGIDNKTNVPADLRNVVALAAGGSHSIALKADGTVVAWGDNSIGQSDVPAGLNNVVSIAAGGDVSLALKSDGSVVAWGYSHFGELSVPAGLGNVVAIAASSSHALALKSDGTVVAWGDNFLGQASVPAGLTDVAAIAAGSSHSVALKGDGTVVAWGGNAFGQSSVPTGLGGGFAIAGGWGHSMTLRDASSDAPPAIVVHPVSLTVNEDSLVTFSVTAAGIGPFSYQWRKAGANLVGATSASLVLMNATTADAGNYEVVVSSHIGSVISNSATLDVDVIFPVVTSASPARQMLRPGESLSLSVTATGTGTLRHQWTLNGHFIAGATSGTLTRSDVSVADSGCYVLHVTDDRGTRRVPVFVSVVSPLTQPFLWGENGDGQLSIPAGLTQVVHVAAGAFHSLAVDRSGHVTAWGFNGNGETNVPTALNNVVALSGGEYHSVALTAEGEVVAWGDNYDGQTNVPIGMHGIVAISAGAYHTMALRADGRVFAWGNNNFLQTNIPANLANVVAIAAAGNCSLALKSDGTVAAWGGNDYDQRAVPAGLSNVVGITGGGVHALALESDSTAVAWGYDAYGPISPPLGLTGITALAAGDVHTLALKSDGSVIAWGPNESGQTDVPASFRNGIQIAAGARHSIALRDAWNDPVPVITVQPANHVVVTGNTAVFAVTASGLPAPAFRWQRSIDAGTTWIDLANGNGVTGTAANTLSITGVSTEMSGNWFRVVVSNTAGSMTSYAASLGVSGSIDAPAITTQPVDQLVTLGTVAVFTVAAVGNPIPTFRWQRSDDNGLTWIEPPNGGGFSGITTATLSLGTFYLTQSGQRYRVVATNSIGSVTSDVAALAVRALADGPAIHSQPANLTASAGNAADFSAIAIGPPPLSYQWQRSTDAGTNWSDLIDGSEVSGVTTGGLGIASTTLAMNGHQFRLIVSNNAGSVASNSAILTTIVTTPVITGHPSHQTVQAGAPATFVVTANGNPTPRIQWQQSIDGGLTWSNYGGGGVGKSASLFFPSTTTAMSGYRFRAVATNDLGSAISNFVVLTVNAAHYAPLITAQPTSQVVAAAAGATFTVAAIGNPVPAILWQRSTDMGASWDDLFDGSGIGGATTATLVLGSTTLAMNDHRFRVLATNSAGGATSDSATLTVRRRPWISFASSTHDLESGGSLTMTVSADGAPPIAYQWQLNGLNVPGATGATLTLRSVQHFHAGTYSVIVTSSDGSVRSEAATLKVAQPPPNNARLLNLSTRAQALTGDDVLIPGFVVSGTGTKRLLIRAVGPTLGKPPFGLAGVLSNPRMRLLRRNPTTQAFEEIAASDNWATNTNATAITQTSAAVFAFVFNDDRESALLVDLEPGEYTAIAGGVNDVTGLAIVELYDADSGVPDSRLINISNRGFCGVGDQVMIPGFVVSSEGPKTLLVRVVGPTLGSFGVPGTMADPKLTVYSGQTAILENDNWSDNPDADNTAQIAQQVFAFPLNAGSKDAAFVVTLQPGSYTVVGSSADGAGTGVVLVEVYVVP